MEDDDDLFYNDEIVANGYTALNKQSTETSESLATSLVKKLKFIMLRLPCIFMADVILLNTDYIVKEIETRFSFLLNFYMLYLLTKLILLFFLFFCLVLFTLNMKYTKRLYKLIALVGLPFLFTYLKKHLDQQILFNKLDTLLAASLICLLYSFIVSLKILLYNDFYKNFIFDHNRVHERYNQLRSQENQQNDLNSILDSFLNNEARVRTTATTTPSDGESNHEEMRNKLKRSYNIRRLFIIAYSSLSLIVNESYLIVSNDLDQTFDAKTGENALYRANIMTLGFLILIGYDLLVNVDQMLLRLLIQLRCLCQYLSEFGLNNLLSFNWFYRLKVPFLLRLYFFIKTAIFTINFILFYDYYYNLNIKIIKENKPENFSLVSFVYSIVKQMKQIPDYHNQQQHQHQYHQRPPEQMSSSIIEQHKSTGEDFSLLDHFISNYDFFNLSKFFFTSAKESTFIEHQQNQQHQQHQQQQMVEIPSFGSQSLYDSVYLYLRMLIFSSSQTIICISATTSMLALQFYLIGKLMNKITATTKQEDRQQEQRPENARNVGGHNLRNRPANRIQQQQQQQNDQQINNRQNGNNQVNENDLLNVGDVAAILFFLLSIQSGLSSLNGHQRIEKFFKNYTLLFIAILHYFHSTLDNQLMTLSASSKPMNWKSNKHLRVLSVCISLLLLPFGIIYFLWSQFKVSTWLLAATAFNIELIVKSTVTVLLYALFMIDSKRIANSLNKIRNNQMNSDDSTTANEMEPTDELSDNLDDKIYVIKAFGHVTEFIVALFLFFNGAYILLFESYGAIRAIMMCIHAYFHIWRQARRGWSAFIKRRTAIVKLKRLTIFNRNSFNEFKIKQSIQNNTNIGSIDLAREYNEQLHELCAICFCELSAHETRITNCNHFFHSICIRKWLYLQDTCPMCHQLVYPQSSSSSPPSRAAATTQQPQPQPQQQPNAP